jgi:hypothetical protein
VVWCGDENGNFYFFYNWNLHLLDLLNGNGDLHGIRCWDLDELFYNLLNGIGSWDFYFLHDWNATVESNKIIRK